MLAEKGHMATDANLPSRLKPLPMSQQVQTREWVGASSVWLVLFRFIDARVSVDAQLSWAGGPAELRMI